MNVFGHGDLLADRRMNVPLSFREVKRGRIHDFAKS
jgi:hypothetical protein